MRNISFDESTVLNELVKMAHEKGLVKQAEDIDWGTEGQTPMEVPAPEAPMNFGGGQTPMDVDTTEEFNRAKDILKSPGFNMSKLIRAVSPIANMPGAKELMFEGLKKIKHTIDPNPVQYFSGTETGRAILKLVGPAALVGLFPELGQWAKGASVKTAEEKKYDVTGEKGEDLINDAHPGGGTKTELDSKTDENLVETIVEQQKKDLEVAHSVPKGVLAKLIELANTLDKKGYTDEANEIDEVLNKIAVPGLPAPAGPAGLLGPASKALVPSHISGPGGQMVKYNPKTINVLLKSAPRGASLAGRIGGTLFRVLTGPVGLALIAAEAVYTGLEWYIKEGSWMGKSLNDLIGRMQQISMSNSPAAGIVKSQLQILQRFQADLFRDLTALPPDQFPAAVQKQNAAKDGLRNVLTSWVKDGNMWAEIRQGLGTFNKPEILNQVKELMATYAASLAQTHAMAMQTAKQQSAAAQAQVAKEQKGTATKGKRTPWLQGWKKNPAKVKAIANRYNQSVGKDKQVDAKDIGAVEAALKEVQAAGGWKKWEASLKGAETTDEKRAPGSPPPPPPPPGAPEAQTEKPAGLDRESKAKLLGPIKKYLVYKAFDQLAAMGYDAKTTRDISFDKLNALANREANVLLDMFGKESDILSVESIERRMKGRAFNEQFLESEVVKPTATKSAPKPSPRPSKSRESQDINLFKSIYDTFKEMNEKQRRRMEERGEKSLSDVVRERGGTKGVERPEGFGSHREW